MALLESRNINTIGHKSFWFQGGLNTAENHARIFARIYCDKEPPGTCADAELTTQFFMQDLSLPLHVNSDPTIRNTYYIAPVWFALDINHANRAANARDAPDAGPEFDWFTYYDEYMPDMFDEQKFTKRCETMARLIALPPEEDLTGDHRNLGLRDDPWLVAYYLGNEIYWFYQKNEFDLGASNLENPNLPPAWSRKHYLRRLLMQPSDAAAWDAFVAVMQDFYAVPGEPDNVSLWNDAYDEFDPDCTPPAGDLVIDEWADLYDFDQTWALQNQEACDPGACEGMVPGERDIITKFLKNDWDLGWFLWPDTSLAFVEDMVEVYYATASTALRNADGGRHPIMSARFPLFPGDDSQIPLARIASQYCDVLCFNAYPSKGNASIMVNTLKNYYNALDYDKKRPFVITEFTYHADRAKGWDACFDEIPDPGCAAPPSDFSYPEVHQDGGRGSQAALYMNELYNEGKGNMYGVPAGHPALAYFVVGHLWHSLVDHAFFALDTGEFLVPRVSENTQNWGLMRGIDDENANPSWDPYVDFGTLFYHANEHVQCELLGHTWNGGTCP